MISPQVKVLLIGYGNPGRVDDGLGPALVSLIEGRHVDNVTVDCDYQLTVEDSAEIAKYDVVIFADASVDSEEPFTFKEIFPKKDITFTTHSIEPDSVLGLAYEMFQAKTKAYVLAIKGYKFDEFDEKMTEKAKENLQSAAKFLEKMLRNKDFGKSK